ncbi:MAG: hypothetical protein GQ551_11580 [Myxococcales bacterium]|nr:hypothetical protein [Myxococcales bacterium]
MSRPSRAWTIGVLCLLGGCEQLGNPPQFATGPTHLEDEHAHLITTTRSFRNQNTIQRLVAGGLGHLDHADASIGPSQTLTLVTVVSRKLSPQRRRKVKLVTIFKLPDRAPIVRRWSAPASSHRWNAAFALPEPPAGAATSVAP